MSYSDLKVTRWNTGNAHSFESIIPLSPQQWILFSLEHNRATGYSWYIDLLDMESFTLQRRLSVHRMQHCDITQLALLPDGKTLIGWNNHEYLNGDNKYHELCLIDTADFFKQKIRLPLMPFLLEFGVSHRLKGVVA